MDLQLWFLLCFLALDCYNGGIIWQAQRVSYPLFAGVGRDDAIAYYRSYDRRIRFVVAPGTLALVAAVALVAVRPATIPLWAALLNVALALVAVVLTLGLEIPRHRHLQRDGHDPAVIAELIRYNWPRTTAITAHCLLPALTGLAFVPASTVAPPRRQAANPSWPHFRGCCIAVGGVSGDQEIRR